MFGSGAFLSERFIGAFQTSCIENSERFSERSLSEMLGNDRIFRSAHTYKYLHFFWNATVEKRGNIPNAHAEICQGKNQAAGARKNAFSLGSLLLRRCRSGSRNGQNWPLLCVISEAVKQRGSGEQRENPPVTAAAVPAEKARPTAHGHA